MTNIADDSIRLDQLADVVKALAHPLRLGIVASLCEGSARVGALVERLGARQTTVSQQLRILRMSGLVAVARQRGGAVYSLSEPRLRDLVACLSGCREGAR
ncbi:MAG TPA: metalloregulator ArsR/SmtB family transcription factor [Polyangia bacterium]|nr:metalloregulator ArsR/SmtB family transcription factor [Polyangia bacterium]